MKTKVLALMSLFIISFFSCAPIQLVPDYSDAIENQIIQTQKMNEKLYVGLLAMPVDQRTYSSCQKEYLEIESNINSLFFQINIREKNASFVVMMNQLKSNFIQYKDEHKLKGTLTDGEIKIYIRYINDFYQPLLVSEKALKKVKK
jgi:hypothetical protein